MKGLAKYVGQISKSSVKCRTYQGSIQMNTSVEHKKGLPLGNVAAKKVIVRIKIDFIVEL